MYVNRLRHDDYLELFRATRQKILLCDVNVDPRPMSYWRQTA